jgi:hypothetical protein
MTTTKPVTLSTASGAVGWLFPFMIGFVFAGGCDAGTRVSDAEYDVRVLRSELRRATARIERLEARVDSLRAVPQARE